MATRTTFGRRTTQSICLALAVTAVLHDARAAEPKPTQGVEEVLVVGTRASLQSAIERKKNADTVADSIVAEDIAQFPDKNIGEALQRVTGVQLQRDFGEGTGISIRGIEPDLNRIEVNGVSVLGNDGTGARRADFREFASELVKSIDVIKGFTADMTEGGIGGTVMIETRKPLEIEKTIISATASAEYLDTTETTRPRGNLTFGTKFLDDRLGVLLNVTYDEVDTRGDFLRDTEWVRVADFDNSPNKTVVNPAYANIPNFAGCNAVAAGTARTACQTQFFDYSPFITRYGIWLRNDKRTSGEATVQYRVSDSFDFYVDAQLNDRTNRLRDNNFAVDTQVASRYNPATVVVDANHNVIGFSTAATAPTATTGAGTIFSAQNRDFDYHQKSDYYSGGFNWDLGKWHISGLGVHST